jgi:hypothetical protein
MKYRNTFLVLAVLSCLVVGMSVFAQDRPYGPTLDTGKIVPCDGVFEVCTFSHLFKLAENLIKFVVTYLAAPVAAIMFVWAGIILMFDRGSGSKATTAKNIFTNTVKGLVLVLAAYLIVKVIVLGLTTGSESSSSKDRLRQYFQSQQ